MQNSNFPMHNRKPFENDLHSINHFEAFKFLARDVKDHTNAFGKHFFPVLGKEDFGIDARLYTSREALERGDAPAALVELEIKEAGCCSWPKGNFPWDTMNFLYRKFHLVFQKTIPFWVCYNHNGTDCASLCLEDLMGMPIAFNNSVHKDPIFSIPRELFTFGTENIVNLIDKTMAAYFGEDDLQAVKKFSDDEHTYARANEIFAKIHRYDDPAVQKAHEEMVRRMQKNDLYIGISSFL